MLGFGFACLGTDVFSFDVDVLVMTVNSDFTEDSDIYISQACVICSKGIRKDESKKKGGNYQKLVGNGPC